MVKISLGTDMGSVQVFEPQPASEDLSTQSPLERSLL